jgi:diguanylate cyclase (GGDEF)-like protein
MLGCTEADWRARPAGRFVEQVFAHPERVQAAIAESARTGRAVAGDFELQGRAGGEAHWVHCIFSVQAGDASDAAPTGFVEGVLYDVTERRRAEIAARHVAAHDTLTGLLNRAGCASLVAAWRRGPGELEDEPYTALFIDLDGFKAVNDRLGHRAGDRVLRETAERLQASVRRSTDLVSRNGGDEFVVVLRGLRPADPAVAKIADQIGRALQQPIRATDDESVQIGVSIGLAAFPFHGPQLDAVLQRADAAMYEVKRTGKNSFAMATAAV